MKEKKGGDMYTNTQMQTNPCNNMEKLQNWINFWEGNTLKNKYKHHDFV